MRRLLTSLLLLALAAPASALAQGSSSSFSQLAGERGCVAQEPPLPFEQDPLEDCARARGLLGASAVAVSPDDRHVTSPPPARRAPARTGSWPSRAPATPAR